MAISMIPVVSLLISAELIAIPAVLLQFLRQSSMRRCRSLHDLLNIVKHHETLLKHCEHHETLKHLPFDATILALDAETSALGMATLELAWSFR